MTNTSLPSAKSSCCDSSIHCHIRKNGLTNECDACGEPCDANQAPDEGKMERLLKNLEETHDYSTFFAWISQSAIDNPRINVCGNLAESLMLKHNSFPIVLSYINSLQSRLKQAEAELESSSKKARELLELANDGHFGTKNRVHLIQSLSSLSNQYPSRK